VQGIGDEGSARALYLNYRSGSPGVTIGGATFPGSKLDVKGNITVGSTYAGTAAPSNGMIIQGNVGIGTTNPGAKLDVAGAIYQSASDPTTILFHDVNESGTPNLDGFRIRYDGNFYGTNADALILEKTDGNGADPDGGISFVNTGNDGVQEPALTIRGNGNVGIGTTAPAARLHALYPGSNISSLRPSGTWAAMIENAYNNPGYNGLMVANRWGTNTSTIFEVASYWNGSSEAYTPVFTVKGDRNVGIGTTAPAYRLELPNIANASGQGRANAWVTYSDIRFKENITPITNALEKINNLQGVYFDWKQNGKRNIGFIAQEVEPVLPEVVSTDPSGIKSLDYSRLTALLVQGIKEQQLQTASQSARVALLEKDLNLAITGDLNIAQTQDEDYQVQNSQTGNIITRLSAFAEIIVGKIKAGLIETKKLIVDGVDILKKLNELSAKVDSQQKEIEGLKEEIKKLREKL
jgi:hypothetical protein